VTIARDSRVEWLAIPFRAPLVTGERIWDARRLALVRVRDEDGTEGIGEAATEDPGGLEDSEGSLRSAHDSARLDLRARDAGRSIAGFLADTPRERVMVNALIGVMPAGLAADTAGDLVEAGFGCLKLKGGDEPVGELVGRVRAVRLVVGPDVRLRVDLNGTLTTDAARELLDDLAPFDLEYVEQPIPPGLGPAALAALRRRTAVPIAADEAVDGVDAARALIEAGAVDTLVVKPVRVGGLGEAHRIAALAAEHEIGITLSTLFETGIGIAGALQLAATLPGDRAHGLATAGLLSSDLLERPLDIVSGEMAVPAGPGLGVAIDEAAVARYRVA
jgi:L-alanine-DL-glutamate epimerase-like enolase superfamily enzyme